MKAAVYCGTYDKYNGGSIEGAWISLANYPSKRKFFAACRELHKDEHEPEFMFQDWENIPTSMVSESHVDDEIWHVINSIKKYAPDRADEFAEWADEQGMEQDYAALSEFMGWGRKEKESLGKKMKKKEEKGNPLQMSKEDIVKALDEAGVQGYHRDGVSNAAFFRGKLVLFYRPRIDTAFCFDDENEAAMAMYHEFCQNSKAAHEHFIYKNMRDMEKSLDYFLDDNDSKKPYYLRNSNLWLYGYPRDHFYQIESIKATEEDYLNRGGLIDEPVKLTKEEEQQYRKLLLLENEKFKKRLESYIKRYGVTKCRYWSYWANE